MNIFYQKQFKRDCSVVQQQPLIYWENASTSLQWLHHTHKLPIAFTESSLELTTFL